MNHWKTTESVTNQAEIIHFGGNVYLELHSLMGCLSVISNSICMGGEVLKHEVPIELKTSSTILSSAANTEEEKEGRGRGGGKRWGEQYRLVLMPLSAEFECTNLILFLVRD